MRIRGGVSEVVASMMLLAVAVMVASVTYYAVISYTKANIPEQEPSFFSASVTLISGYVDANGTPSAAYSIHFTAFSPKVEDATVCVLRYAGDALPEEVPNTCKRVILKEGTADYAVTVYVPLSELSGCAPIACPYEQYWMLWLFVGNYSVDAVKMG